MFGLINLHKPTGPTSRDCVTKVQRLTKPIKVGHAGTLDPIASGVLLLLVGNATRLTDEIHSLNKEYLGTFKLGVTSPSVDIETEVTSLENPPVISESELSASLDNFLGTIEQIPPIYSAIRIAGKRAHELARDGEEVTIPPRRVTIEELELAEFAPPFFKIRTVCSTGTYIRSLGRDIARSLGSDAIMTDLVRTRIGNLHLSDSVSLSDLDSLPAIEEHIQPPQLGLTQFPHLIMPPQILTRFQYGQKVDADQIDALKPLAKIDQADNPNILAIDENERLRGILTFDPETKLWRTAKFFN